MLLLVVDVDVEMEERLTGRMPSIMPAMGAATAPLKVADMAAPQVSRTVEERMADIQV